MSKFIIHGTRGTMPVAGHKFIRYGGRTTCFSLKTAKGIIIFDAGTGIAGLSALLQGNPEPPPIAILFTHFHIDHVLGLPAFAPLYNKRATVTLMADDHRDDDWRSVLKTIAGPPLWPLKLQELGADISFKGLPNSGSTGASTRGGDMDLLGARISWRALRHPQQCLAFRIETAGLSVVIATDREHGNERLDSELVSLAQGADFLIYDAQYTPAEYPDHAGWGHSTWIEGTRAAEDAGVKQLVLTHHNPPREDFEIDGIVAEAKCVFSSTVAAYDGMPLGV